MEFTDILNFLTEFKLGENSMETQYQRPRGALVVTPENLKIALLETAVFNITEFRNVALTQY